MVKALIFLLAIMALVQVWAYLREARIAAAHPPTGQFIEVDGLMVHYQVMGEGPDLVLLHGASGNLNDFTLSFTDRLTDRYRVILFDRPGLGYSDRLPHRRGAWNKSAETPAEQADLLIKAADQLDVENPIVLGHSFGGVVALSWGLAQPDNTAAVVLAGAVSEPWPGKLGWIYRLLGSTIGGALAPAIATVLVPKSYINNSIDSIFQPQPAPEGYADHIGADLILRRHSNRANAQQVNGSRPYVVEMKKQYGTLTMPIEIVHGTADTIVPADIHAKVLIDDVPNGALTLLEGQGHMPQHTAAQEVEDAIDRAATRAGLR